MPDVFYCLWNNYQTELTMLATYSTLLGNLAIALHFIWKNLNKYFYF